MVTRMWHGWTVPENADAYQRLLLGKIFPGIESLGGFQGIGLLRRDGPVEVEFVTLLSFDSLLAVEGFAGKDYERAVISPGARALLSRFEEKAQHYETVHRVG